MSETNVQLNGYAEGAHSLFSEAEGFLLGPEGEVWDIYPRLGYVPRLQAHARDGVPAITSARGRTSRLGFRINHRSHYMRIYAVSERLQLGVAQLEVKNGHFELRAHGELAALVDGERTREPLALLEDGHWVGTASSPYLLICPRAADAHSLLKFARGVELPRLESRPWTVPAVASKRERLSPLASSSRLLLERRRLAAA